MIVKMLCTVTFKFQIRYLKIMKQSFRLQLQNEWKWAHRTTMWPKVLYNDSTCIHVQRLDIIYEY